jgi:putative membrane protein
MFALAFVLGLVLWLGYRVFPGFPTMVAAGSGWLHATLALVVLLFAAWVVSGRWLKRVESGGTLPSTTALRWFNEVPVLLLAVIVWLVLAKPF